MRLERRKRRKYPPEPEVDLESEPDRPQVTLPVPTVNHTFVHQSLFHTKLPFHAVKVRRSVRGKNVTSKDEEEKETAPVRPATSPEKDESQLPSDSRREPQKTEVKAASAEPQPGNQTPERCLKGKRSRTDIKGKKNKP